MVSLISIDAFSRGRVRSPPWLPGLSVRTGRRAGRGDSLDSISNLLQPAGTGWATAVLLKSNSMKLGSVDI